MSSSNNNPKITPVITLTFYALIGSFAVIIATFFIPAFRNLIRPLFLIMITTFSLLGIILTSLTLKQKVKGSLKKFLILTGASAAGFMIFTFFHNGFYALAEISSEIRILNYLMQTFEVLFFLAAIFICPIGFLIGSIRSIVLFIRNR